MIYHEIITCNYNICIAEEQQQQEEEKKFKFLTQEKIYREFNESLSNEIFYRLFTFN